jgi:lipopolysaccharide transport system permease protein
VSDTVTPEARGTGGSAARSVPAGSTAGPSTARRLPVRVLEPRRAGIAPAFRELWRFRRLGLFFGKRFITKRYSRTWLGMLWLPLRPGVTLATRILIYGGLIGIATGETPYALTFVVATAAWQLFYESVYWSVRSMELNRKLLTTTYVPRTLLVFSAIVPSLIDFGMNMCFVVAAVLYYLVRAHYLYIHFGLNSLLAVAGLVSMVLIGLGIGLFAAGISARTRDIRFSLPFVLGFLYFVTPIIYPLSLMPPRYRPLAELNPLTGAVEMVRDGLFATNSLSGPAAIVTVVAILLLWGPGLWLADRREVSILNGGGRQPA